MTPEWPLYKPPEQGSGQKMKKFRAFFVKNVFLGILGDICPLPRLYMSNRHRNFVNGHFQLLVERV